MNNFLRLEAEHFVEQKIFFLQVSSSKRWERKIVQSLEKSPMGLSAFKSQTRKHASLPIACHS
jgi:hypothetical protein